MPAASPLPGRDPYLDTVRRQAQGLRDRRIRSLRDRGGRRRATRWARSATRPTTRSRSRTPARHRSSRTTSATPCSATITVNGVDHDAIVRHRQQLRPTGAGASCTITASRTVLAGDPDPLPNTVTVSPTGRGRPHAGPPSADTDSHSVNLFQPSVDVDKTGDTLSKVGDTVNYTITVTNTSSADSPDLVWTISDTLLGDLLDRPRPPATARPRARPWHRSPSPAPCWPATPTRCPTRSRCTTTRTGSPTTSPTATTTRSTCSSRRSTIDKTGDTLSKIGDAVNYTITVTNTSSADSPNLTCTVSDAAARRSNKTVKLAPGAGDVTNATRTVLAGDPDPLVNTATVDLHASTASRNVLAPSPTATRSTCSSRRSTVDKTGDGCAGGRHGRPTRSRSPTPARPTARTWSATRHRHAAGRPHDAATVRRLRQPATLRRCICTFTRQRTMPAGDPDPLAQHGHGALPPGRLPQRHHRQRRPLGEPVPAVGHDRQDRRHAVQGRRPGQLHDHGRPTPARPTAPT